MEYKSEKRVKWSASYVTLQQKAKLLWEKTASQTLTAAAAKSLQSCPTVCDPRDGSPLVPVILQARTLEWVAISFSNAWKWKVKVKSRSRVQLLATPWTAAYQAPPSMGFSRQEYWSGVPLPSPKTLTSISQKQDFESVNTLHIYFYTFDLFLVFIFLYF